MSFSNAKPGTPAACAKCSINGSSRWAHSRTSVSELAMLESSLTVSTVQPAQANSTRVSTGMQPEREATTRMRQPCWTNPWQYSKPKPCVNGHDHCVLRGGIVIHAQQWLTCSRSAPKPTQPSHSPYCLLLQARLGYCHLTLGMLECPVPNASCTSCHCKSSHRSPCGSTTQRQALLQTGVLQISNRY